MQPTDRIVIFGFQHKYQCVRNIGQQLVHSSNALGFSSSYFEFPGNISDLGHLLKEATKKTFIFLGSPALNYKIRINNSNDYLWRFLSRDSDINLVVLDQLPYDFRFSVVREYFSEFKTNRRLHVITFEQANSDMLSVYSTRAVGYHPAPVIVNKSAFESCTSTTLAPIMFWGSYAAELSRVNENILNLIERLSFTFGVVLSAENILERLIHSNNSNILHELKLLGLGTLSDWIAANQIDEICEIDSFIKRTRRLRVVSELAKYDAHIYGKGWEKSGIRFPPGAVRTPSPDHNAEFSRYLSRYDCLFNMDPNWGHGTNERATTAIAMGKKLISNCNGMYGDVGSIFQYSIGDETSIRNAIDLALASPSVTGFRPFPTHEGLLITALNQSFETFI